MPWKKNPITLEKIKGLARYARGLANVARENIVTPEGRDISQSSPERLYLPDLFHTLAHMLSCMCKVINGLNIYPDNLAQQIAEMRGLYAGNKAKELLAKWLVPTISVEEVYRIIQLASFCVTEPNDKAARYRLLGCPISLCEADTWQREMSCLVSQNDPDTLGAIIRDGRLRPSSIMQIDNATVQNWNELLRHAFREINTVNQWEEIFLPSYWLKNEAEQIKQVLGE